MINLLNKCFHRNAPWLLALIVFTELGCAVPVEFEKQSEFSHLRVRREGDVRTLLFVQEDGSESIESRVNIEKPHELISNYTRFMFSSYLVRPKQERVLIIGLGGGAMIHFLKHNDPDLKVDVVEIDPVVVHVSDQYFNIRGEDNVRIVTADAKNYLSDTKQTYDVIYLDAYLAKSIATDSSGVPLRLKTEEFYKTLQQKLTPGGLIVFNLIARNSFEEDVLAIRNSFSHVFLFEVPFSSNYVLVGCTVKEPDSTELKARAKEFDRQFDTNFSFHELLDHLDQ